MVFACKARLCILRVEWQHWEEHWLVFLQQQENNFCPNIDLSLNGLSGNSFLPQAAGRSAVTFHVESSKEISLLFNLLLMISAGAVFSSYSFLAADTSGAPSCCILINEIKEALVLYINKMLKFFVDVYHLPLAYTQPFIQHIHGRAFKSLAEAHNINLSGQVLFRVHGQRLWGSLFLGNSSFSGETWKWI